MSKCRAAGKAPIHTTLHGEMKAKLEQLVAKARSVEDAEDALVDAMASSEAAEEAFEKLGLGDPGADGAVPQRVGDLRRALADRERDDGQAGAQRGEERDHGLDSVIVELIREPVAGNQAEIPEAGGKPVDAGVEIGIGVVFPDATDRDALRHARRRLRDDVVEVHARTKAAGAAKATSAQPVAG